jgi:large repetitive protein
LFTSSSGTSSSDFLLDNVTLTAVGVANTAPVANGDSYSTGEDTPLTVLAATGLLTNDTDANSDPLTAIKVTDPTSGAVTVNTDGSFTYTPNANFNGSDSFTYKANDLVADSNVATVNITVNAINDAPVAVGDSYTTPFNTPLVVSLPGVLTNDTDAEGSTLSAMKVTDPANGSVTVATNGSFTYTPGSTFSGADSFTYKASDGTTDSNTVTVSLTVNAPTGSGLLNGSFESGAEVVSTVFALADWTPTPAAGVAGTPFGFAEGSGYTGTDPASPPRRLAVFNGGYLAGSNVFPSSISQTVTTVPGQSYDLSFDAGIYAASSGTKTQNFTVTAQSQPSGTTLQTASASRTRGTVGTTYGARQTLSFTATTTSTTFLFTSSSGSSSSDFLLDNVTLTAVGVGNTAPVASGDSYSTGEDTPLTVLAATGLLANDTDANSNPLTAIKVTDPTSGAVTVNTDGSFTYTPNSNFNGSDSFTYKANDLLADSNIATVSITVNAVNDAPVAVGDSYTTPFNTPLVVTLPGVLANDTDVEGSTLSSIKVTDPSNGTIALATNGSFTYTPGSTFSGSDSFTYKASDSTTDSNTVTVNLTVNPPAGSGLLNGSFESGAEVVSTVFALADWTPTPAAGVAGTPFGFAEGSGYTGTDPASPPRRLAVFNGGYLAGSNVFPSSLSQTVATVPGQAYDLSFDAGIYSSTSGSKTQAFTVAAQSQPGGTTLQSVSPTRTRSGIGVTYAARQTLTFTATTTLTTILFTSTSGTSNSDFLLDHVTLTAVGGGNIAPVANADSYSTNEDTPLTVLAPAGLLANDTDGDSDPLTAIKVSDPTSGSVTLNTDGSFTYAPNANFNGSDSFTYKANDLVADSNVATVTITVNAVNDAPVAVEDSYSTPFDTILEVALPGLLGNDTDAEGSTLSAIKVTDPANGSLTVNSVGSFIYEPGSTFSGVDSFTYKANDGTADSNVVTVNITVDGAPFSGILNGSFENGVVTGTPTPSFTAIDDWTRSGTQTGYIADSVYTSRDGARIAIFNANSNTFNGQLAQTFTTDVGQEYTVALDVGIYAAGATGKNQRLEVKLDGSSNLITQQVTRTSTAGANAVQWGSRVTITFTANSTSTTLTLRDNTTGLSNTSASDLVVDHVVVQEVTPNVAPVAVGDTYGTTQGVALTVAAPGVLTNDTDGNADTLTAVKVTDPASGTVTLNTNGSFTYTPDPAFTGTASFTYKANDGVADSNIATVAITVSPNLVANGSFENGALVTPPQVTALDNWTIFSGAPIGYIADAAYTARDGVRLAVFNGGVNTFNSRIEQSITTVVGQAYTLQFDFGIRNGATSSRKQILRVTATGSSSLNSGSYEVSTNPSTTNWLAGSLTFVANSTSTVIMFSDTLSTTGLSATSDLLLDKVRVSTIANSRTLTVESDPTGREVDVIPNDLNGDGIGNATFSRVFNNGTAVTLTAEAASGASVFQKWRRNGVDFSTNATVNLTMNANETMRAVYVVDNTPRANDDTYATAEDNQLSIGAPGLLSNDVEPNSLTLSTALVSGPASGDLDLSSDGSFTYDPAPNFNGSVSFTYQVSNGTVTSDPATVTISVTPENDPPSAVAQTVATDEDTPLAVSMVGTDPDGDALTYLVSLSPMHGQLSGTGPNRTYTPNANYFGPDSFEFTVTDGIFSSSAAVVSINVNPVSDPPVANAQSVSVTAGTSAGITLTGTDPDGDPLTYTLVSGPTQGVLNGTGPNRTYIPVESFVGSDSFTFTVSDGVSSSAPATVSINVTGILLNGSFEDGTMPNATHWTPVSNRGSGSGTNNYEVKTTPTPTNGSRLVGFNTGSFPPNGVIRQTFATTPGRSYELRFDLGIHNFVNNASRTMVMRVKLTGSSELVNVTRSVAVTGTTAGVLFWKAGGETLSFVPNSTSTTLEFTDVTSNTGSQLASATDLLLDNVRITTPVTRQIAFESNLSSGVPITVTSPADINGATSGVTGFTRRYANGATVNFSAPAVQGAFNFQKWTRDGVDHSTNRVTTLVMNGNYTMTAVYIPNAAPATVADAYTVNEDVPLTVTAPGVLSNDSDPEAVSMTASVDIEPANGTLVLNPNGSFLYTPGANFFGSDSFTYIASDGVVQSVPTTVNITVNPVNDVPVATAQSVSVVEDGSVNITLAGTDIEGSLLTYSAGTASNGLLGGTAPNLTYTPNANYSGPASFTFTVNDGTVNSIPATVSITVTPVNDAPVASGQAVQTAEDTAVAINLVASDVDGNSLTYTVGAATNGMVSGTAPNLTYTPNANYTGPDSFTFSVNDGTVGSNTATVTLNVTAVNDVPVATAQSVTVDEDGSVNITLAGTDVEGSTLTFSNGNATSGMFSGTAPNLTYTPTANFAGSDSFTFTVSDGTDTSAPATVSITVNPINDAPVANSQSLDIVEDTQTAITLVTSDIDGDTLTYTVGTATNGIVSGTAPNLTYMPNANYTGPDSFTFSVNDGTVGSNTATVTLNVTAVNDVPVATAQSVTVDEDGSVNITLAGTDVEGSTLTFTNGPATSGMFSGTAPNLTYTPIANFAGSDSFTFTVSDGTDTSAPATVSITVTPINDAPVANNQSLDIVEDTQTAITLVTSDIDGDTLTYTVGTATNGIVSGTAPNLTYMPNANYTGPDSFTFSVNDGTVGSNTATVTLNVTAVNDVPVATAQSVTVDEDGSVNITLAGTDVEGSTLTFTNGPATSGMFSGTAPNLTYTPIANFAGSDSFTFTVSDGTDTSAPATVSITVTPINDAPVANNQSLDIVEDTQTAITLVTSDIDGDPLTYSVGTATNGMVTGTAPNLTYTPNENYTGPDSFTFSVNDGTVGSNTATVTLNVTAVNDVPVATAQSVTVDEDGSVNITLAGTDVEGSTLTFTNGPATSGMFSGTAPNLTYTPIANFAGSDSFTFTVSDGTNTSAPATVSITVNPINDVPVATAQSVTVDEDGSVNITLAGTDVEGSTLTFANGPATSGMFSGTAPNLTYTPIANFAGSDSFTFTVSDGTNTSAPATVSITVTPINDAPVANSQSLDIVEDTQTAITLVTSDIDGDPLTYSVGTATNGMVTGTAPNLTYTPNENYTGPDSFTFSVNDGTVGSNTATVTLNVTAVNDVPVAIAQSVTVDEDGSVNITLAGTDVEGSTLTFANGPATSGMFSGTAPNLTYTPIANFAGSDSFTFTVSDGTNTSAPATVSITVNPINDVPVATAQSVTVDEDGSVNITLAGTDVEGSTLTFANGPATSGMFSGTAPNLTYTPIANFAGSDSFTFTVSDGTNTSAPATVSITVNPINDVPVATAQSVTVDEDGSVNITLAGTDVEGSTLTFTNGPATSGMFSGTAPNLTYTPIANFAGSDSFTFTVSDGTDTSAPATVSITVNPINDAPVANSQSLDIVEDTQTAITLVTSDIDGDTLTYTVGTATNGMVTGTAPNLTYMPNANYTGPDSFTFSVNDGTVGSNTATVTLNVTAVNDVPVATAQSVTVDEDGSVNITLAGTDVEGSTLTFTNGPATSGMFSGTAPNLTYTPIANFAGSDSFTFTVSDGTNTSAPATVSITVNPINDVPVATAQSVTVDEDGSVNITLAGTDVEGSTLTFANGPATSGMFSGTAPNLTYTPIANFAGSDSFTFTVSDGTNTSAPATVSITVTPINDAPVANSQSLDIVEDTQTAITLVTSDIDGDPLTYSVGTATNGMVTGTAPNLTYTPNENYTGPDSFTFSVNDGTVGSNTATVTLNVTAVNDVPVAIAQSVTVDEDGSVNITLAGTDVEGSTLTFANGPATSGMFSGTAPNLTYTPIANFAGSDSFTFTVSDGTNTSAPATVSITVNPINDVPVATAQSVTVDEDGSVNITLAGTDVEGSTLTFANGPATSGMFSGTAPNLTYTPIANFAGSDSFTFTVSDGTNTSAPATVSITVNPINDVPVATAQSVTVDEDGSVNITLAGTDVEGSTLTFANGPATSGMFSGTAPNLTYTPIANFAGSDSFTFTVSDGTNTSAPATVSITVTPINDAPVANSQSLDIVEDTQTAITLVTSDIDGDPLTYSVGTATNGMVTGTAPNLTYMPNANYTGPDSFTFSVNDGTVGSNTATVTLNVTAVNDVPVAIAQSVTVDEDGSVNITLAGTDVEGSTLTFSNGTATNGVVSGTAPNLTYTPNVNYSGPDSFTFMVNDGTVNSLPATVSITVNEVAEAGFLAWLAEYGLVAGPTTDSDKDSISNAVEYVIGGNPANQNNANLLPVISSVTADPDNNSINESYLLFTYRRTDRAKNDPLTTIRVQWNASLFGPWTNTAGTPGVVTTEENDLYAVGVDRVRVYIPKSLSPGGLLFARLSVFINAAPANEAPVALNQAVSVNEDSNIPIALSATDLNGDSLTYSVVAYPTHGSLSGNAPNFVYTPFANYSGPDSFTFKAMDQTAESAPATISITVNPLLEINQWLSSFGITAGPGIDSDGDSVSNALEYVIGGNPATQPDAGLLPVPSFVNADPDGNLVNEDYLLFTYRRTHLAKNDPDTLIKVEWNTTLTGTWTNIEGTPGVEVIVESVDASPGGEVIEEINEAEPGVDLVKVYIPRSLSVSGKLFARLGVVVSAP